jgi:uncharacterized Zn finger protein
MPMKLQVRCQNCQAELEVELLLETNETLADDEPEEIVLHCPRCGGPVPVTADTGTEGAEIRVKNAQT